MVTNHSRCSVTASTRLLHPREETTALSINYLFLVSCFTPFSCEIIIEKQKTFAFLSPSKSPQWSLTFDFPADREPWAVSSCSRQADSGEFFGNGTTTATTQAARSLAWSAAYKHLKKWGEYLVLNCQKQNVCVI